MADTNLFDLAARVSIDNSGVDAALASTQKGALSLAKEFEATELVAKKSALGMATSMAAVNAEIGKMKLANLTGDYEKFSNALKNNSVNSRLAADAFLNLFPKVASHSQVAAEAEKGTNKLAEAFRMLSSSAVVIDGPLGGVAGRLRAIGTDAGAAGGLLGPGGLIALGLVGIGVGAVAAGIAIFEMASKAAEAGKQILEISQKTNLSTESISAFRVAAELSGTSIDRVGNKLAGFNVVLGQAQSGNKAMAKIFTDMGVDIKQTSEGALTQFLKKFDEMGPTAQRNALEAKLFRDRTGELIPLLIQMGGSLDEAKKQAYDLGLSFDNVSARSAKEFDDKLKLIKLGSEGLATQIGMKDIPAIEAAMNDLSKALGVQENSWRAWGEYIGNVLSGVVINTGAAVAAINQFLANIHTGYDAVTHDLNQMAQVVVGGQQSPGYPAGRYTALLDLQGIPSKWSTAQTPGQAFDAEQKRLTDQVANYKPPAASPTPGYSGGGGGGGGRGGRGGGKGSDTATNDFIKGLALQEKEAKRTYDNITHVLDSFYSHHKIGLADYITQEVKASQDELASRLRTIGAELAAAEKLKGPQGDLKRKEILDKQAIAENDFNKKQFDLAVKQSDMMTALADSARTMQVAIETEKQTRILNLTKDLGDQKILSAQTTEQIIVDIELRALQAERKTLELKQRDARSDTDESEKIGNQIAAIDAKIATAKEAGVTRVTAARRKDITDLRSWANETANILNSSLTQDIDTEKRRIQLLESIGQLTPKQARTSIAGLDIEAENAKFAKETAVITAQLEELKTQALAAEAATIAAAAGIGEDTVAEATKRFADIMARYSGVLEQMKSGTGAHDLTILEIKDRDLVDFTAKMHTLATSITGILDNAIHVGFDQGIKEGFRAMAIGFLQMIEKMAEDWLASSIFKMLQSVMSPTGGGGGGGIPSWLGFIIGLGGAVAGGAAGGWTMGPGSGTTPMPSLFPFGHAAGLDFVPYDNYPAMLHKGEAVIPASQNRSGGQGGVVHNHYHQWNITTQDARSFQSQDTERQITQRANRIMQRTLLTG